MDTLADIIAAARLARTAAAVGDAHVWGARLDNDLRDTISAAWDATWGALRAVEAAWGLHINPYGAEAMYRENIRYS